MAVVALDRGELYMPFDGSDTSFTRFASTFTASSGLSTTIWCCGSCTIAAGGLVGTTSELDVESPTSAIWSFIVTLTLNVVRAAGVRALAPIPGVLTVPGVRMVRGVRFAGVLAPDERAVPERRGTRDGFGVGASISSTEGWTRAFLGTRFRSTVRLRNQCASR